MAKKEKPFTVQMKEQVLDSKKQDIVKKVHNEYSVDNTFVFYILMMVIGLAFNVSYWCKDIRSNSLLVFCILYPVIAGYELFINPRLKKHKLVRMKLAELESEISKLPVLARNYYSIKLHSIEQDLVGPQSKLFVQLSRINESLEQQKQFQAKFSMAINDTQRAGLDASDLIEDLQCLQESITELERLRSQYETIKASIEEFLLDQRTKCASLDLSLRNAQLRSDVRVVLDRGQQTIDCSEQLLFEIAEELDARYKALKKEIQDNILETGVDSALQSAQTGRFIQDMQTIDRELEQAVEIAVG